MSWLAQPGSRAWREPEFYASISTDDHDRLSASAELHGLLARIASRGFELRGSFAKSLNDQIRTAYRARLTRSIVVRQLNHVGITPVLLKGAALVPWTYRSRDERTMGDIDLLVRKSEIGAAFGALRELGAVRPPGSLPAWHVALWHFNVAWISPEGKFLPVEIHWRLHSEAFEGAQDPPRFRERSSSVTFGGVHALLPDPADIWIHVATHFASHLGARGGSPLVIPILAESLSPPAGLRWVMDLVEAWPMAHTTLGLSGLVNRIREARADAACVDALAMLFPLLSSDNLAAAMAVAGALGNSKFDADALRLRCTTSHVPSQLLGVRRATLSTYFRWLVSSGSTTTFFGRVRHAAVVLARTLGAGFAFPFAWCARSRPGMHHGASEPKRNSELAAFEAHAEEMQFRSLEASEDSLLRRSDLLAHVHGDAH